MLLGKGSAPQQRQAKPINTAGLNVCVRVSASTPPDDYEETCREYVHIYFFDFDNTKKQNHCCLLSMYRKNKTKIVGDKREV